MFKLFVAYFIVLGIGAIAIDATVVDGVCPKKSEFLPPNSGKLLNEMEAKNHKAPDPTQATCQSTFTIGTVTMASVTKPTPILGPSTEHVAEPQKEPETAKRESGQMDNTNQKSVKEPLVQAKSAIGDPVKVEQAKGEPAEKQSTKDEQAKEQQPKEKSVKEQPGEVKSAKLDRAKEETLKMQHAEPEALKIEPVKAQPDKIQQIKVEPVKDVPAKNVDELVKEKSAEEKSAEEKPVEEKPAKEKLAEEKPAKEKPAKEKPAEEKPAKEKPAEEKPAKEKPAEEKPAKEKPAEEKRAKEKPAEEKPAKEKPTEEKSAKEKPAEEQLTLEEKLFIDGERILRQMEEREKIKRELLKLKKVMAALTDEEEPEQIENWIPIKMAIRRNPKDDKNSDPFTDLFEPEIKKLTNSPHNIRFTRESVKDKHGKMRYITNIPDAMAREPSDLNVDHPDDCPIHNNPQL